MPIGYTEIANEIAAGIRDGQYPDTLPSIHTLAGMFKVCPATVKRVISQLRDWDLVSGEQGRCVRVNPKAAGNPYFHKNIVICANLTTISNSLYSKIIQELNAALDEHHVCLHLFISEDQFRECGFKPDCIVAVGINVSEELEKYCPENKIIKLNLPENGFQGIATDNRKTGYEAIRYLAEDCGHRHIGVMNTQLNYDYGCFYLRHQGIMDYVKVHPEIKLSVVELDENLENTAVQRPAIEELMQKDPEITAIFAACDLYALGIYSYAKDHDLKIPDDLSVLGFGDQLFASLMNPPLSTFSESAEDIGDYLIKLVLEVLQNPNKSVQNTFVSPKMVCRGSVIKKGECL